MATLAQGQSNDSFAPELVFIAGDDKGQLVDLESLEFQIFRATNEAGQLSPVQVFPAILGTRESVDLTEAGPDRIGLGRYAAPYTVAVNEPPGLHEIRWFWRFPDGPERRVKKLFDVVVGGSAPLNFGPAYTLVSEMRAEGVSSVGPGAVSDLRLMTTIVLASQYIDAVTGRRFGAYHARQQLSGRGSRALMFGEPIIAIERVGLDTAPDYRGDLEVEPSLYRVFNRHLRGMIAPDDRENPKLEFVHSDDLLGIGSAPISPFQLSTLAWTDGVQNCDVLGVFGFTDPDGSPWGEIPGLIRHAAKMLVMREMCLFWDVDCREDWKLRWRVTSVRTRDQSLTLANPRSWSTGLTGDPELDGILGRYARPPVFGAA